MLGISVYLSEPIKEIQRYIDKSKKYGVKNIFTSMHITEENSKDVIEKIKKLSNYVNERDMSLMIDISTNTLSKFNFTFNELIDFYQSIGIKKLRIDYGFSTKDIFEISKKFEVILNASTIDEKYCNLLEKAGLNLKEITVCHNFYPRVETGLSEEFLLERNKFFKKKGFKIQAFIQGDEKLRGPIFKGLPTLEDHRNIYTFTAYLDLIENYLVDEVLIGDISVKNETFERIFDYYKNRTIALKLESYNINNHEVEKYFWKEHKNRKDFSKYVIRSTLSRVEIKSKIEPFNSIERKIGSITIDNKLYGRYNGEIQIVKVNLNQDDKVNVLGNIDIKDIPLLKYIKGDIKFIFKK